MTPARRTPGSVTTKTREPPAAATTSGSRSIAPTPNRTRLRRTISNDRSARRVTPTSTTVSVEVSRRTVSQRRQPTAWNQRSVVTPSGFSKIQTSSKSRSSGSVIQSGTARRSPPNVNSSIGRRPQRGQSSQSISASPPSPGRPGRGRARKRSSPNGAMSAGGRPVAMNSAIPSPPAGIALKPHVPHPVVIGKPSTPVAPMIGEKSAEMSQIPAHVRRIRRSRRNGSSRVILYE